MLSPRWKKVLRDLWGNRARTLLVVLSIAVGVFAVGMIAGSQTILSRELSTSYLETNPASAAFYGSFDEEMVQSVRNIAGVEAVEGRASLQVRVRVSGELPGEEEQWKDLSLSAIPDFEEIEIHKMRPLAGSHVPDSKELLVERTSLQVSGATVGDRLLIETPDGRRRELEIVGTVHDLRRPSALIEPTLHGYVTLDTLEWLGQPRTYDELLLTVSEQQSDREHIERVADRVKAKIEKGGGTVFWTWIPSPGEHWAEDIVQALMMIMGILGFLALILSGFLVVNTISALLTQQTRQIGMMKAIGAQTSQLIQMYLATVVAFGLLSLLVAIPLGVMASYGFVNFMTSMLNFYEIELQLPLQVLLLEVAVGLLVPLLAALWPVFSGTRVTVREAISSYGLGKGNFGNSRIDRLLTLNLGSSRPFDPGRLLSRPILLSLRNTFRRKGRLLLTLSTLVLGGAIFIAIMTVHASLMSTLDLALSYWNYHIDIDFNRAYRIEQMEREARRVPGVKTVESWAFNSGRRLRPDGKEGPNMLLVAPPAATELLNARVLTGRWLLPEDENAIVLNTPVTDEEPDVEVGDEIVLKIMGRESTWRVVGIVQSVMTGPIGYANYPYFTRVTGDVGRASGVRVVTDSSEPAQHLEIASALKEHFEQLGFQVQRTAVMAELRSEIVTQFNILVAFLAVMAILIAFVGGLGLMGTMSINVLERSREIGVMRAIGASDGAVMRIFLVEGMTIGLLSWLAGSLLALPISRLLSNVVGTNFLRAPLQYTFSVPGALVWLIVILGLAALATLWPAWRASRLTVHDVLAYQ